MRRGTHVRRGIIGGFFTVALLTGCTSLEPGNGRPGEAGSSQTEASSTQSTETTQPSTETTESTESTESTETIDTTQPTGSEDPALAFAIGFQFAAHVNTDNLQLAYDLLCPEVREDVTLEEFSDGAPEPGTLKFDPGEQIEPGMFSGTLRYGTETDEITLVSDGAGSYCVGG
ncbi:MAG: hypothetical protein ACR2J5_10010 [Geodermatophilaceae bacterium]